MENMDENRNRKKGESNSERTKNESGHLKTETQFSGII